jgi:hypothetical protein
VAKKFNLPMFEDTSAESSTKAAPKPTLEVARQKLGGKRGEEDAPPAGMTPGALVEVTGRAAIVLYATGREVHVLLEPKLLKKVSPADLVLREGALPTELASLSADARVFGGLAEGQWVRYADDTGDLREGKLVEKCRYGGLVARTDGAIVAVGFRKLWPATEVGEA